jgi:protein-S-isoprenylcysteine O-methyltransferase Ste14
MRLVERMEQDGGLLFQWRGMLPLLLLPAVIPALAESARMDTLLGSTVDNLWMLGCFGLSLAGLGIRCLTVGFVPGGTSGRSTVRQRADRLNTSGMHSLVRNPLYVGNFVILLGVALATKVSWVAIVAGLAYAFWIERIVAAEEAFLAAEFGGAYSQWVERTPAFLPRLGNWRPPDLPFSWRMVLRREYAGLLTIAAAFLGLELITDLLIRGEAPARWAGEDIVWLAVFGLGAAAFVVLRLLNRVPDGTMSERGTAVGIRRAGGAP